MLYAIIATDHKDSLPIRQATREAHLKRIHQLRDQGRVILAGPHPAIDSPDPGPNGFTGSLMVLEFDSLEDAQQWVSEEPYLTAGVFADVQVKPFVQVVP